MNQPKLIQCGTCLYFRNAYPQEVDKPIEKQRGTCHKNPPTGKDGFPRVEGIDFCGQGIEGTAPYQSAARFVSCSR